MRLPGKRQIVASLLYYGGVVHAVGLLNRMLGRGGPVFLTGHRVLPASAALSDPVDRMALLSGHAITPDEMGRRLSFLRRWLLPAGDPADLRLGLPTRRAFYLTFDDGYLDNVVHAAPVLERIGVRAVIFVVTDLVARPWASPWWDRWGAEEISRAPDPTQALARYNQRCVEAKADFAGLGPEDLAATTRRRYLTRDEIDSLPAIFDVANHTRSHANLAAIDAAARVEQIEGGETALRGHPRWLALLAYPFGRHDAALRTWLREQGRYRLAFATGTGVPGDALGVRRINLNVASFALFASQCAGVLK